MTPGMQAAQEARRRRRHWRSWPWGLIALVLAGLAWCALGYGVLVGAASFRPPGDGSQGIADAQARITAALVALLLASLGSSVAAMLGWQLRRWRASAAVSALLLGVMLAVVAPPLLSLLR
ncbi:hypothetical protein [Stenotrophomonas sp. 24(2023)]|uniref:hypothetical protein n=1 Tax=Stenotrophomonas sp. 24(2023) TaxID=3068324 RepID=UPI0027DF5BE0|nr:hypothetical protein [Stenotrophomonas sp. 24(2023)]WMJ68676.1 hypothetical protein Q9R17_16015 [Stenotrophomonas sp. 24(2023)]